MVFSVLVRNEGKFVFPLEVKIDVQGLKGVMFISEQQEASVAFPAYRVYLYNETSFGAEVFLMATNLTLTGFSSAGKSEQAR